MILRSGSGLLAVLGAVHRLDQTVVRILLSAEPRQRSAPDPLVRPLLRPKQILPFWFLFEPFNDMAPTS